MKSSLFLNAKYLNIEGKVLPYLKLLVILATILIIVLLYKEVSSFQEAQDLHVLEEKIFSKLEENSLQEITNRSYQLKAFQETVKKVGSVTGLSSMTVVKILNILEKDQPESVRVRSLEYHANKMEYTIRATAIEKEDISIFLEKLQSEAFNEVLLTDQQQSAIGLGFILLLKVS